MDEAGATFAVRRIAVTQHAGSINANREMAVAGGPIPAISISSSKDWKDTMPIFPKRPRGPRGDDFSARYKPRRRSDWVLLAAAFTLLAATSLALMRSPLMSAQVRQGETRILDMDLAADRRDSIAWDLAPHRREG
ncbi:hypothetical protein [Aurantimonas sp. VKM B-3413]|uniref:hypothetical protein n=1 Tax=Aurantimonas sp. VKM B-3413 TaxID=2779401 RepID=UPI001E5AEAEF|nr:hypothetical protein [Aurantimonas sp. VKM B-3413]MCB8835828.1 hypothetical protein [Aurantimonas sp. VKM B-3413]